MKSMCFSITTNHSDVPFYSVCVVLIHGFTDNFSVMSVVCL